MESSSNIREIQPDMCDTDTRGLEVDVSSMVIIGSNNVKPLPLYVTKILRFSVLHEFVFGDLKKKSD